MENIIQFWHDNTWLKHVVVAVISISFALLTIVFMLGRWKWTVRTLLFGARQKVTKEHLINKIKQGRLIEAVLSDAADQAVVSALANVSKTGSGRIQVAAHFSLEKHLKDLFKPEDVAYFRTKVHKTNVLEVDYRVYEFDRNVAERINHFMLWGLNTALISLHLEELGKPPFYRQPRQDKTATPPGENPTHS